ncbi:MAG: gfo/Idh/MocA family oxidoreductase [Actinobacteria bacterium]|jgi:predicted dehydrogenase|nr:gfo/Idh/MocA family oxidoreductase [Actinomycetota bacterium]NCW34797.1 gfo/Idh/MocA family oxidoreductase [Actinomycetota bacterium]NDA41360.1 gfo/Idh/MocA family oxidoreductase [Actinomycetota bacterium]NDC12574.1 gfo/Idh/MocA family oxidoreductase [Actinomycetota bacterium]NDE50865.1 gfo/Idh/MocA family oxidoreductase [Actinomycetota bacterium]
MKPRPNIRWGIIGTGGIARTFAKDLTEFTDHQIAAVGSRTREKAETFARPYSAHACASYEELVATDVDAIYVATPHTLHASNTILALEAGKPVLVEKPFAINAIEAKAMIDCARSRNLLLMEAMWSRYLPHYKKIRELIADGELGEVIEVIAEHGQPLPYPKYLRLHEPELGGGALLDLGIYPLSFAFMILGNPESVKAVSRPTASGVDATTSAVLKFAQGSQALINTTLEVKTPCTAVIIGTKARIEIDGDFYTPTSMRLIRSDKTIIEFPRKYEGHGLREQALYFGELLNNGKTESDLLGLNETLAIMSCMDEIRSQIGLKYPSE